MRRMIRNSALLTAAVAALLTAALALATMARAAPAPATVATVPRPNQVEVLLSEYKLAMAPTSIPAGVPLTFVATNKGSTMHEVVLEKAGAVDQPFEMNGRETEIENIAPGQTKSATWTITQPGEYQLGCHLPGHFDAGMVERFTVTAAAGSGQGKVGAPMQVAALSAENQAEHEDQPAPAASPVTVAVAPATLPASGSWGGVLSPLGWLGIGLAGTLAAIAVTFRWLIRQITPKG